MLNDKAEDGEYKIPFLVVCDAFHSEMTAFADLLLPDTTYLERHDCMSMLDRPISEFDGPVDSVRIPVLPPTGQCKPFQEVLVELAGRLQFPAFVNADGSRKYRNYPDFIVNYETAPGSGIGFLAGWRGKGGEKAMRGEPNPRQWEMYEKNNCVFQHHLPPSLQYMRNWNQGYMDWAQQVGLRRDRDPIVIHVYSEFLQRFRLAAQGKHPGRQPPDRLRQRVQTYFDPLPFFYAPLEQQATDTTKYPLNAVTQRPMAMYHSWDSQTPGCARSTRTTTCSSTRAPRRPRASPTAAGCGSSRPGARCAACAATPRPSSPARCGHGTRSASSPAPGTWSPAPTSRARASCSIT